MTVTTFASAAAVLVTAAGLVVFAVGAVRRHSVRGGLGFALELWLAAGLLRLTGDIGWERIAVVAVIVTVRRVVGGALRRPGYDPAS